MDVDDKQQEEKVQYSHEVPRGALQRPPINIGPNDQVTCTFPTEIGRGMITKYCNRKMILCRRNDLVPYSDVICTGCLQAIKPGTQFVAVCFRATYHTNGSNNIICCRCLELDSKENIKVPKVGRGRKGRNKEHWHIKKDYLRRKY